MGRGTIVIINCCGELCVATIIKHLLFTQYKKCYTVLYTGPTIISLPTAVKW